MKYAGIYFTLLWVVAVFYVVTFVPELRDEASSSKGYVCPPCSCSNHGVIFSEPGRCSHCLMPLIPFTEGQHSLFGLVFFSESTAFLHHKIFYPINFLALFIGIFSFFRFRRDPSLLLFLLIFLSVVLFSFKNQLYGNIYSMPASRRWLFFPISFLLAIGPAYYLYCSKTKLKFRDFKILDWLHFLPVSLLFFVQVVLFFSPESIREMTIYNRFDNYPILAEHLIFIVSFPCYVIYAKMEKRQVIAPNVREEKWCAVFNALLVLIWGSLFVMTMGNLYYYQLMSTMLDYHPVWLAVAMFTLWCSYYLVFKKEKITQPIGRKEKRLDIGHVELLKVRLEEYMQHEKPYLNSKLTLQELAYSLGIKEKDLSEVLNAGFSMNFYAYINSFRIHEVKQMLLNPEKQHLTNFAIAQEAGFKSKSTFFGLFKKHVGMTPGEFKRKLGKH